MPKLLLRALALTVTLFALHTVALADPADARALYKKGLAAYALEHFADAADAYEKAFAIEPDPALLYNAAQAHRLAGNYDRALHLYQSYLRIFGKKASNRAEVERHITELQGAIATQKHAQQSPPTGIAEPDGNSTSITTTKPLPTEPPTTTTTPDTTTNVLVATPPVADKPVYKKGWFWGVVVGAAVVVAVGVGLGVGLSSSGSKDPTGSFGATTVR